MNSKTFASVILLLINIPLICWGQKAKVTTGIMLLTKNTPVKFDTFLVCDLDTTQSLQDNLKKVSSGVLKRVSLSPEVDEELLKNNSIEVANVQICFDQNTIQVIPIAAEFGKWAVGTNFFREIDTVDCPVKMFGSQVANGYKQKMSEMIMRMQVLRLEK